MLKEIEKRFAMRPLFLWLLGILIQVYYPCQQQSVLLLLPVLVIVVLSFFFNKKYISVYSGRWVWGVVMSFLFVFLSIQVTELSIRSLDYPFAPSYLQTWAMELQSELSMRFERMALSAEGKSLLATLTLGNRTGMSWELKQYFSASGVAHILAVSGFHVGVVFAFLDIIFRVMPSKGSKRWFRFLFISSMLLVYLLVTGMSASTVRATLMVMLYLVADLFNRSTERYNLLATVALLMLVFHPLYLFDIGFQLSFVAVFSIMYIYSNHLTFFKFRNPIFRLLWQCVMISVAAQVGTFFLCLHYFGSSSLVFLFTNVPVMLLSILLIPASLLWLFMPEGFFLTNILQVVIEMLAHFQLSVVARFAETEDAVFKFNLSTLHTILAYVVLIIFFIYLRKRKNVYLCKVKFRIKKEL